MVLFVRNDQDPTLAIAKKTAVDFIDDLELPGQHVFEPRYRPLFERFAF